MQRIAPPRAVFYLLFTVSGFAGLIYESIWTHYLKLYLGHAAYAQSLVLVVFMGGMAAGAAACARFSERLRNPLAAYAIIEAVIGLAALGFHEAFVALTDWSYVSLLPGLGGAWSVLVAKLALACLLILPQSVLLGATFPLMSAGLVRAHPRSTGESVAMLYFTNSLGAALGVLASGFLLIAWTGLPGTLRTAGAINLALAALVWLLSRPMRAPALAPEAPPASRAALLLLAIAFLTGLASFVYEIAWIRMLSLVLGASTHAFELMLSTFILGLALGGYAVRRRVDATASPERLLGWVQVAMGLCALLTLPVYDRSFELMEYFMRGLARTDGGYILFNVSGQLVAALVMLPATFCAGMTLPLITGALLRRGAGERALGQVYAANTLGAIAGVLLAVHVLLPVAGLKISMLAGATLDIVLGAWLLRWSGAARQRTEAFVGLVAGLVMAVIAARAAAFSPERLVSGVYRYGKADAAGDVLFYRDGKTASIAVLATPDGTRIISTNGKPDAGIQMNPAAPRTEDEYTMTLLGALPLLARPEARSIANIGYGSGLTNETIVSHAGVRSLDVIEIEPAMAIGAYAFHPRVDRLFRDRRTRVHFEDAKSFFARRGERYDVIVSEPSNPWVSGVASLFTREFYADTVRYLEPGGLFVQWLQFYELNDRLLASMFGAMDAVFADYEVYQAGAGDLVVLAVPRGRVPALAELPATQPAFRGMLAKIGITRREQVLARRVGTRRELAPLFAQSGVRANSDYRPLVQLEAPRSRYLQEHADGLLELAGAPLPVLEMLAGSDVTFITAPAPRAGFGRYSQKVEAFDLQRALVGGPAAGSDLRSFSLRQPQVLCGKSADPTALVHLHSVAVDTLAHLGPRERRALWVEPRWLGCPLAKAAPEVRERFALYRAVAERDARAMLRTARSLLDPPPRGNPDWGRFVLMAAVLGAQADGQAREASRLWSVYSYRLLPGGAKPHERYVAEWKD